MVKADLKCFVDPKQLACYVLSFCQDFKVSLNSNFFHGQTGGGPLKWPNLLRKTRMSIQEENTDEPGWPVSGDFSQLGYFGELIVIFLKLAQRNANLLGYFWFHIFYIFP